MISAKEYFEEYLTWKKKESSLRSASYSYESYAELDSKDLIAEAEAGNPGAQEELGERYLFGVGDLPQSTDQAVEQFQKAAAQGHPDAMHLLADIHRTDEFGLLDYDLYFSRLAQAAERGSWKAMFNYACALYKGSEAYEGHGPAVNKPDALTWSSRCAFMTMNLLELFFRNNCSNSFTDYLDGVFALFVQSVNVSARQLILGDGVPKSRKAAKRLLTDAQKFYSHYFGARCSDFDTLLAHCDEAE